jgi:hypothetical protein
LASFLQSEKDINADDNVVLKPFGGRKMADPTIKIDLDEGRVMVEGDWLSEDEVKNAIKAKISSEDFDIAPLADSLKNLQSALENSTMINVRVAKDMAKKFELLARDRGEGVGNILREALGIFLAEEAGDIDIEEAEEDMAAEEEEPVEAIEENEEEEEEDEDEEEEESDEEESDEEEDEDEGIERVNRRGGSGGRRRRR